MQEIFQQRNCTIQHVSICFSLVHRPFILLKSNINAIKQIEYENWLTVPIYGECIKIQTDSESFYLWSRDYTYDVTNTIPLLWCNYGTHKFYWWIYAVTHLASFELEKKSFL